MNEPQRQARSLSESVAGEVRAHLVEVSAAAATVAALPVPSALAGLPDAA